MREIKFRGKIKDDLSWWYGSLVYFPDSQSYHIIPCGACKNGEVICNFVEVQKDTIGQFTGIRDIDGTEIYEGDILCYGNPDSEWEFDRFPFEIAHDNPPYIVKWYVEGFPLICTANNGVEGFDYTDEATLVNNNFKVIGNIHDNPELIKN